MKRFIFGFILISAFLGIVYTSYKILEAPTYKIKFNTNGGSIVESLEVKSSTVLNNLPETNKKDYDFVGWYLNDEPFDLSMPITKDYTLEAKWQQIKTPTYTITFDTLNGNEISPLVLEKGTLLNDLPIPKKNGYQFITWLYQNKDATQMAVNKNMTLVAKWQKIKD